jgi:hypothetical protein
MPARLRPPSAAPDGVRPSRWRGRRRGPPRPARRVRDADLVRECHAPPPTRHVRGTQRHDIDRRRRARSRAGLSRTGAADDDGFFGTAPMPDVLASAPFDAQVPAAVWGDSHTRRCAEAQAPQPGHQPARGRPAEQCGSKPLSYMALDAAGRARTFAGLRVAKVAGGFCVLLSPGDMYAKLVDLHDGGRRSHARCYQRRSRGADVPPSR